MPRAVATAGSAAAAASRTIRRSCVSGLNELLLSVLLEPPVGGAPRDAERACGVADVAAVPLHRLADEQPLDLLEGELLEPRPVAAAVQREVGGADPVARGHEDGALDGVVELADVPRPA